MKNENSKYEFLGENLYKFRKEKGLSQEELADKINVSRQSIHLWEAGKIVPDVENILKLSDILCIPPGELVNGLDKILPSKPKIDVRKIGKRILLIILILLIIYVVMSLRKSFIIINIDKKVQEFSSLDNYSYTEHNFDEKDLKQENNRSTTVYYKDGICLENFKDFDDTKNDITLWINRNENKVYSFDNKQMTYSERNVDEFPVSENKLVFATAKPTCTTSGNNLINLIYGFNPNFHIESKKDKYITVLYNQVGNLKLKICEHIDKETGLINAVYTYYPDGRVSVKLFEMKLNETQDSDVTMPNLDDYKN